MINRVENTIDSSDLPSSFDLVLCPIARLDPKFNVLFSHEAPTLSILKTYPTPSAKRKIEWSTLGFGSQFGNGVRHSLISSSNTFVCYGVKRNYRVGRSVEGYSRWLKVKRWTYWHNYRTWGRRIPSRRMFGYLWSNEGTLEIKAWWWFGYSTYLSSLEYEPGYPAHVNQPESLYCSIWKSCSVQLRASH